MRAILVLLSLGGCIQGAARPPHAVNELLVADFAGPSQGQSALPVEKVSLSFGQSVDGELSKRNIKRIIPTLDDFYAKATRARSTRERMGHLAQQQGPAWLLMVEMRAERFTEVQNRSRWTVHTKLSLARRDDPEKITSRSFKVPVFLPLWDQSSDRALVEANDVIADEIGKFIDDELPRVAAPPTENAAMVKKRKTSQLGSNIYFIMIDRFHDGDPSNNHPLTNKRDANAFYGGDIAGVIAKLDYLRHLGVDTIWLSPVFAMRHEPYHGHAAFHGYWTEDLSRLDPHFGREQDLRNLRKALDARNMRLILDVVLNHTAPDGEIVTKKPTWFHKNGAIEDWNSFAQLENNDVHGLPDLDQDNDSVYQYLVTSTRKWVDAAKPDALRLDAVKHISPRFWKKFNQEFADVRKLGEFFDGDASAIARSARTGHFDAMFDFPLYYAVNESLCQNKTMLRLASTISARRKLGYRAITFVDNHDLPRIDSACGAMASSALALLFVLPGTPVISYGSENAQQGATPDASRAPMRFATNATSLSSARGKLLQRLLRGRSKYKVLRDGRVAVLGADDSRITVARFLGKQAVVAAFNRSSKAAVAHAAPRWLRIENCRSLLGGKQLALTDALPARSFFVWRCASHRLVTKQGYPPRSQLTVNVGGLPADATDVRLVGEPVFLGRWKYEKGVRLKVASERHVAAIRQRAGDVAAYKVVYTDAAGAQVWEQGANRYLSFPNDGTRVVEVTWRK